MGRINLRVEDELEKRFRDAAGAKFGAKKGSLQKAFKEAAELWIKKVQEEEAIKEAIGGPKK